MYPLHLSLMLVALAMMCMMMSMMSREQTWAAAATRGVR